MATIGNSSLFNGLIESYILEENREKIKKMITVYEDAFKNRIQITRITPSNFYLALDNSIDYIDKANSILATMSQIEHIIRYKLDVARKQFELEEITVTHLVENSEILAEFTSKTDKDRAKKFMMKEKLISLEQQISTLKTDLDAAAMFTKTSENHRDLVFAYYQGVKKVNNMQ